VDITFIGGGNMATALIGGLVARGVATSGVKVVEVLHEARARHSERFGITCVETPAEAVPHGDAVVLAVKPQNMREACHALAPHVGDALVLSIAAGTRLADIGRWLGGRTRLARCMPNTPALVGAGISAVYARPEVSPAQREIVQTILEAAGKVVWVDDEALLDPVTALSGSGPAYMFYFLEAMQQAAAELGLEAETGKLLAVETMRGAAELAARSSEPASVLRERVTSKGGTTERALASMNSDGVREAIVRAIHAADRRARELGDELGRER
jgi:pyrroline-5-carboxylate reductase